MANIISVNNETKSVMTRMTKDGRKLTYEMQVLQQPQRARACGSGAKSSADRRPVDPPPVVELKILEGDSKTDVTFSHNANFFLYTTLESARPIAQSRGNTVPPPLPVLTGTPVAGMAYLDRPSPAGYFIFPDLSVRHEGKYRLSFNLFEELKESKDADVESAAGHSDHPTKQLLRSNPMAPQAHVHFRLEVKSEPFVVFSAKKFPGLAESTTLSRVVAEQGCRVRIRRDVRMRRRDPKASKDYDDYDEEGAGGYSRPDRYTTPEMYNQHASNERARSVSNVSCESHPAYPSSERRPSVHDSGYYAQQPYQPQPLVPMPQPASTNYNSHLAFGSSSTPQYQTPALPMVNPPTPQPSLNYSQSNQYQAPHARQMSTPQIYTGYQNGHNYQHPQYPTSQPYSESSDYKPSPDYRRTSGPASAPSYPSQPQNQYPAVDTRAPSMHQSFYSQPMPHVISRSATPSNPQLLPPLKTLQPPPDRKYEQPERKYEQPASTNIMPGPIVASSSNYDLTPTNSVSYSTTQPAVDTSVRSKRPFGKVFDSSHLSQSSYAGIRPEVANHGHDVPQVQLDDGTVEDEDDLPNLKLLSYRRADGSRQHKKCPSPIAG